MVDVVVKVSVAPTSRSVPGPTFVGVPPGGQIGQFLAWDNTWRYPDAAAPTITKIAAETLSGHRVVFSFSPTQVAYADAALYLESIKILGLTTEAALSGDDVVVQTGGIMIEPSWSWVEGVIYLSTDGQLTQVVPTSGLLVPIGVAVGPNALQINIGLIIDLG